MQPTSLWSFCATLASAMISKSQRLFSFFCLQVKGGAFAEWAKKKKANHERLEIEQTISDFFLFFKIYDSCCFADARLAAIKAQAVTINYVRVDMTR